MIINKTLLFLLVSFSTTLFGQVKRDTSYISQKYLIGVWQIGSPRVGNGLNQNFEFYSNGRFVFHNGKIGDDLVSTTTLKGKYRLSNNHLFFTFTERIVVTNGKIGMVDPGIDFGIFDIEGNKQTEIKETNPTENPEPAFITVIGKGHIKINDENYYKIDPKLLKEQYFSPDVH